MSILKFLFGNYSKRELKRIKPICDKILAMEPNYKNLSDEELISNTQKFKKRLANGETTDQILPEAFAVCREASSRVLGMKHFPVQIIGGIVLHQGRIAEMQTGEGKTLVATLPAYLNGLTGKGVHVVTVNDYLAKRDSEIMGKLYKFLGLTVGTILSNMPKNKRKQAYNADITYITNNELGFDYLKDNMVTNKNMKVQRGHNFAIVDEVDSILIDEARTPLIISGEGDKSTELYSVANNFVKTLRPFKVTETNAKEDTDETYKDCDYVIDEKAKTATLTPEGVTKAEKFFSVENLMDPEHATIQHHINQALKAYGVMQNEIDYVVREGQVIIVDEFTGRLMHGRRYNDGLHQAIEAKENVKIERESKTLASITFQNYFRLYNKLSGMTGTASTEETEFREIYKLDIVEIPTNKPVLREDLPDVVYISAKAKFKAIVEEIIKVHATGQPILVGTISIEKSEMLSKMLQKRGIKHSVLNAKYHEREAEIVAQAGKKGAVTIATNMAGRGTDIKLGGNAEFLAKIELKKLGFSEKAIIEADGMEEVDDEEILEARKKYNELYEKFKIQIKPDSEEVKKLGGLYIIGTERHETRRIDNQLRGRSGRQGDPGKSRFFLSAEDDLIRIFGNDRMKNLMKAFKFQDDEPIDSKMFAKSIETAQRRIEGHHYAIRKNVLQYDDVLNRQREIIYGQRDIVLNGENVQKQILDMIADCASKNVNKYLIDDASKPHWNLEGLRNFYLGWVIKENDEKFETENLRNLSISEITDMITNECTKIYCEKEDNFGSETMRELERIILLQNVDKQWMEHIDAMDELKRGIGLRGYAQRDPVIDYRVEGFDMFNEMISTIRQDTVKSIITFNLNNFFEHLGMSDGFIPSASGETFDGQAKIGG